MTTSPRPDALDMQASFDHEQGEHAPMFVTFRQEFATREAAEAFVARFPKSARLVASNLSGCPGFTGHAGVRIKLLSDGANGGVNETGIKRYRTILRAAAQLGVEINYVAPSARAVGFYLSREEFEQYI